MKPNPMTIAALLTVPAAAAAQDIGPVFDMGALTNTLSMDAVTQSERQRAIKQGQPDPLATRKARPVAPRLTYTVTPALRRAALDGYLARMARTNPNAAKLMAAQFAQNDAAAVYRGITASTGLRDNDTADILTSYTVLSWLIATGGAEPSAQALQAARGQFATALAANPQASSPATRGKLGEELKLLFVTLHGGFQSARREGNVKQFGDGVAVMYRNVMGTDLRALRLTDRGFVKR